MVTFRHRIEYLALEMLFALFRLLPLDKASWLGGFLARMIGPHLKAHRTAQKNLQTVFPEKSEAERKHVLSAMWDNLGRTAAELPWLPTRELNERVKAIGIEHFPKPENAVLFFSAHIANWELVYPIAHRQRIPLSLIYRHANNPLVNDMIEKIRATQCTSLFPKGPLGAVKLVRALKGGNSLAMLIDQKMNDGIAVPFFGRDAMTAAAIAQFALRYNMPIIPARIVRLHGAHFEGHIQPPLAYEKTGDDAKDTLTIMTEINRVLESWIREHPEQWFWVHQRWPKDAD